MKPRLLDLFCGAGGATAGYQRAGFYVVGVDVKPQPNYCGDDFCCSDALEALVDRDFVLSFDAVHASPPCQSYTTMSNRWRGAGGKADSHPALIAATRELLERTGLPYVIENVPGSRSELHSPVVLNGPVVGLTRLDRPRLFETNWPLLVPRRLPPRDPIGVYGNAHDGRLLFRRSDGSEQRAAASLEEAGAAMGIDWMPWDELRESIPPAYTELIGAQLLAHIERKAA